MNDHAFRGKVSLTLVSLLLVLLVLPFAAMAQSQAANGTIVGIVKDASGAVIPGATVTIGNVETGQKRTLLSEENGEFRAPLLRVGKYNVDVTLDGFAPYKQEGIILTVGETVRLNVTMKVAGTTEEVVVRADADIVDTTKTQLSTTIDQNYIQEMPLNGRNYRDLVLLTPGVTTDGQFGQPAFHGIQGVFNSVNVDGADNNNAFFGEPRSRGDRAPFQFSQDAVKEFQVIDNNYSAEFGRAAGGVLNVVTKSGTNDIHGNVFYFIRHDEFNARNFREAEKPSDVRHQFGGSVGGPIAKDRFFYFFNVDQQVRRQPITVLDPGILRVTYTDAQIAQAAKDMKISEADVRARLASAQDYLASLMSVDPRTGAFNGTFGRDLNQTVVLGKIDGSINEKNNFYVTFNYQYFKGENSAYTPPVQYNSMNLNGTETRKTGTLVGQLTTLFSPRLINEFRGQYGWDNEPSTSNSDFPSLNIGSSPNQFRNGRATFLPRHTNEKRVQALDNVSFNTGIHELKAGIDFNYLKDENFFPGSFGGTFAFNSVLDFAVARYSTFSFQSGNPLNNQSCRDYAAYIQDRIRVTDNFAISAGIRFDYQDFQQPSSGNPLEPRSTHFDRDPRNIAPRLGFSWSTPDRRFAVRGGYGIFYARTSQVLTNTAMVENGIVQAGGQIRRTDTGAPTFGANWQNFLTYNAEGYHGPAYAQPDIRVFAAGRKNPMVHQANFEVEREVTKDISVSLGWNYAKGDFLPTNRNVNLTRTGGTYNYTVIDDFNGDRWAISRPIYSRSVYVNRNFRNIIEMGSAGRSVYHGAVLQVRKRFSDGFSVLANYTFSKAIDNGPSAVGTSVLYTSIDQMDPRDRSLSNLQQAHILNISGVFAPKFEMENSIANAVLNNWKLAPRFRYGSGRPFTLTAYGTYDSNGRYSGNLNDDPYTNDRVFSRNTSFGPGWTTVDLRISRIFNITETKKIEFIAEAFNILNQANFYTPDNIQTYEVRKGNELHFNSHASYLNRNSEQFKDLSYINAADPRQFQFAVKFIF